MSAEADHVRAQLEAWASAVRRHDLEAVVAHHADDIVYFDVPEPPSVRGLAEYRRSWPPFFAYLGASGRFDLDELHVVAGSDVAFAHALLLVRGANEDHASRIRLSVGLRKLHGRWLVTHEHHSAPFTP